MGAAHGCERSISLVFSCNTLKIYRIMTQYDFSHSGQTEAIIGAAFEVLNTLGHGLLEKAYENALCVEFRLRGIPYEQQPRFHIKYKGEDIGTFVPDLIAFGNIVVDTKTIERITNHELGQMLNYLKVTEKPVGLILNFKYAKLEKRRVANTPEGEV